MRFLYLNYIFVLAFFLQSCNPNSNNLLEPLEIGGDLEEQLAKLPQAFQEQGYPYEKPLEYKDTRLYVAFHCKPTGFRSNRLMIMEGTFFSEPYKGVTDRDIKEFRKEETTDLVSALEQVIGKAEWISIREADKNKPRLLELDEPLSYHKRMLYDNFLFSKDKNKIALWDFEDYKITLQAEPKGLLSSPDFEVFKLIIEHKEYYSEATSQLTFDSLSLKPSEIASLKLRNPEWEEFYQNGFLRRKRFKLYITDFRRFNTPSNYYPITHIEYTPVAYDAMNNRLGQLRTKILSVQEFGGGKELKLMEVVWGNGFYWLMEYNPSISSPETKLLNLLERKSSSDEIRFDAEIESVKFSNGVVLRKR